MEPLPEDQARQFLTHNKFGVLGLADGGRAYALPLFYAFDGRRVYFHTYPGDKTSFLQSTEEACFTVVRVVSLDDWTSVMVFGRVEEVPAGRETDAATNALMTVPLPPRWGETETGEPKRGDGEPRLYMIAPTRITARQSARPEMDRAEREIVYGGG